MVSLEKIISGGQTGADRGALDGAIACGFSHGGALPAGRKTEAGPLGNGYRMEELRSSHYPDRTEKNVRDGDGTLILSHGKLSGGSALTSRMADKHSKPCLHIDFIDLDMGQAVQETDRWLERNKIRVLNVAGPRASSDPGIYQRSYLLVVSLINKRRGDRHEKS